MKNNGLFSALFIEDLKKRVTLDDAAQGRMATLAQTWRSRNSKDEDSLWGSFLKQALGYLEFVPPARSTGPGVYELYEDWSFAKCISVLYLVPPGSGIDDIAVGRFYPAKLLARLKERQLNWGVLTDGSQWRLYSTTSSRPYEDYVELPLVEALEGSDEAEYGLFERFFHRDSFVVDLSAEAVANSGDAEDEEETGRIKSPGTYSCRLDSDRNQSEQVLEEIVKKPFLAQVDEVLQYICNGFIFDTQKGGQEYTEKERAEIFESAVKLIYRCLFLFYAEARRLLPTDQDKADLYRRHSIQALCFEARKFRWGQRRDTDQYDLWKHLKGLISAVNDGDPEYGIMGYNGGLFDDEEERFLGRHQLRNDFLSRALYLLAFVEPFDNEPDSEYAIPYEDLEVRHLGELYETILEYSVQLADADRIRRRTKKGVEVLLASQTTKKAGDTLIRKGEVYFGESALERKQTGSYYTPESLVRFLNRKTVIEPLSEIFERNYRHRFNDLLEQAKSGHDIGTRRGAAQSAAALVERFAEKEILSFKVCDPAMGSGHFLVDAANQMAGLVIALLAEVPHVEGMKLSVTSSPNEWRRRVTRHCIYGVDLNPLAVNLAKLSLWLNCFATHHKLTFLDHHVRFRNSLIGIRSINQLAAIPDRKKDSKKNKGEQRLLFDYSDLRGALAEAAKDVASITRIDEDDTDRQKVVLDEALETASRLRPLADLYTVYLMNADITAGSYRQLFEHLAKGKPLTDTLNSTLPEIRQSIEALRAWHSFYHWPLEFPDVFGPDAVGGFSATVGNPPWDIVKPNSQEFFSDYDPKFRSYDKQKANRESMKLMTDNPTIAEKWRRYCEGFAEQSTYFKEPLSYSALGNGDINTFKLFLEQFFSVLSHGGRMGVVVPSGVYTDQGCQPLRELFFSRSQIEFLYCFENRWPTVFTAVDGRFKFVTFGTQKGGSTDQFKCAFMEHDPERLQVIDVDALKLSVKQVEKFSPDTLSVMEFKSQRDIAIMDTIYGKWPLMGQNVAGSWNLVFEREVQNPAAGYFTREPSGLRPLVEGKWIHQFDYGFSTPGNFFDERAYAAIAGTRRYIKDHRATGETGLVLNCSEYRLVIRRQAASTNERTLISTVVQPGDLCGDNLEVSKPFGLAKTRALTNRELLAATGIINACVMDFVIRNKVTTNINKFYLYQSPLPRDPLCDGSNVYGPALSARVARLVCVSSEFAHLWRYVYGDHWRDGDFWYPSSPPIDTYGPAHEQEIRRRLRNETGNLTRDWGPHCGVHDRLPDRRDAGDRVQLRAEIDAYVAHLYGLSRENFAYILDTFPVLKKKEEKAFGEFISKRKCLEEYDRLALCLSSSTGR